MNADREIACVSCGICSSRNILCTKCEIATLKANGISVDRQIHIRGLQSKSSSHGNGFQYSKLYHKLKELIQ